ncbi:RIO1 family-domain-containing protein [Lineolata rhizophorae]|uniref:Serine/threonine-protein kinase RIO1 n=1 Tax=Lineolata rhizophorae TaxID=578093 RepID=A0A6A6NQU3_9PEZI|nr:RIO1 family-domain-containing protein [Lineolata rhizophorae]
MPQVTNGGPNVADGLAPGYIYVPNSGYQALEEGDPRQVRDREVDNATEPDGDEPDGYDDDDFAASSDFDSDSYEASSLAISNPSDYTKIYNRDRRQHDPNIPASELRGTNPQHVSRRPKPSANAAAAVDDQIAAMSRHAAKIKLDERWGWGTTVGGGGKGLEDKIREKDKADRATVEKVLDPATRLIMLNLINNEILSEIHGVISTGKEANVYHALSGPRMDEQRRTLALESGGAVQPVCGEQQQPVHLAVKVYKTAILAFKDRTPYASEDFRLRAAYKKSSHRQMVKMWADKEMHNLKRIRAAGIPCPEPFHLRLHVLVMGLIGDSHGWPAPRLHNIKFEDTTLDEALATWTDMYRQVLGYMRIMYQRCKLVHADLSEYNLLYHEGKPYVIDVSQAVGHEHPRALDFLRLDIKNMSNFFERKGVDCLPERAVFNFIVLMEDGSQDTENIPAMLDELYENHKKELEKEYESGVAVEDLEAKKEVDTEVFRQQYIPRTLEQVYDIESELEKGEGDELVYKALLSQKVANGDRPSDASESGAEDNDTDSESGSQLSQHGKDDPRRRPRGRKFEDKDVKRQHKAAVKEEKREKRKNKMAKAQKKKLVKNSTRRK